MTTTTIMLLEGLIQSKRQVVLICVQLIRIFPSIRALPRSNVSNAHNPEDVTNNHLIATICSDESLTRLSY